MFLNHYSQIIVMIKRKRIRDKGKTSLSKYFRDFNSGDFVALVRELSVQGQSFQKRMQGRTGRIVQKRGSAYVVEVFDYNKKKQFMVKPIHLRRIEAK